MVYLTGVFSPASQVRHHPSRPFLLPSPSLLTVVHFLFYKRTLLSWAGAHYQSLYHSSGLLQILLKCQSWAPTVAISKPQSPSLACSMEEGVERWSRKSRKNATLVGAIIKQVGRNGISIMKPLVNCSWWKTYFTQLYWSLCILQTLFHWVEATKFYETPNPPPVWNKFLLSFISKLDNSFWAKSTFLLTDISLCYLWT